MPKSHTVLLSFKKLHKLALPVLHINPMPISYPDSINYLKYIFGSNNSD